MKHLIKSVICTLYSLLYGVKHGCHCGFGFPFKVVNKVGGSFEIGDDLELSSNSLFMFVRSKARLKIGNRVRIAHHFQASCAFDIQIGDNVNIAPFVFLGDHNHRYEDVSIPVRDQGVEDSKPCRIIVGEDSWIGTKVSIIGNVKIGKHCVIGANSVVAKDIPDYCVAAGIPAKVIKQYNFETKSWERVLKK